MTLSDADLKQVECPMGVVIEIAGEGAMKVEIPRISLLEGISHVHRFLSHEPLCLHGVSQLIGAEFDPERNLVKASVAYARAH